MLDKLQSNDFDKFLNQNFRMHTEDGTVVEMELVEAKDLGEPATGDRRPFSLMFRHRAKRYLPQRIYKIEHGEMGELEIFLVPMAPDEDGSYMQAVFN
jgi:hypothetical protein